MSTIYEEALLDAKKIREAAELAARERIMETITPQIRDLINKRILFEDSESLDLSDDESLDEEGDEDFDIDEYTSSLPDVDEETQEMALDKAAERATVTIHAKGDVNIDMDDDGADIKMAENFVRLVKNEMTDKGPMFCRVLQLSEDVRNIKGISNIVNENKLNSKQREIINRSFAKCFNEAVELSALVKQGRGSQRLEEKLRIAIKEMREMSSKYGRNIFDFLFEAGDADKTETKMSEDEGKKTEAKKKKPEEEMMKEADEDAEGGEGDTVDKDTLASALKAFADQLGLDDVLGGGETPDTDEDEGDEEDAEGDEGDEDMDDDDMDEGYEEGAHAASDLEEAEEFWSEVMPSKNIKPIGEGDKPKAKHVKPEDDDDLEEMHGMSHMENEGDIYEIDEAALRRELNRLREGRLSRSERTFDVNPSMLTRIIAEEVEAAKSRRLSESSRRSVRQSAPQVNEVAEYKKAVNHLKQQLVEMNLFNAKLLYANKLLQNKNLTVKQQRAIVEALDNAKTLGEAKLLYRSLSESLSRRGQGGKVVSESVNRTLGSSSRSTRSGSPANSGVETDRWAVLAGISKN